MNPGQLGPPFEQRLGGLMRAPRRLGVKLGAMARRNYREPFEPLVTPRSRQRVAQTRR
jgi:hypothetical protein